MLSAAAGCLIHHIVLQINSKKRASADSISVLLADKPASLDRFQAKVRCFAPKVLIVGNQSEVTSIGKRGSVHGMLWQIAKVLNSHLDRTFGAKIDWKQPGDCCVHAKSKLLPATSADCRGIQLFSKAPSCTLHKVKDAHRAANQAAACRAKH